MKEKLEDFVDQGGTLVTSFFSGIADENDGVFPEGYPGPLKNLLGLWVEKFDPLEPQMNNKIRITRKLGEMKADYTHAVSGVS